MGDVIQFRQPKPSGAKSSGKGRGLCRSGFHKWEVTKETPFDVKKGRLVSGYTCSRCGAVKNEAR